MTVSSETFTPGSRRGGSRRKKSTGVDLSNPDYRKPFEFGWLRELVYRNTSESGLRRNADAYYYTPTGKKVRSGRELLEHLTGELTLKHFTFAKEPIGLDSSKEIIRGAKPKTSIKAEEVISPAVKKAATKAKPTSPKSAASTSDGGKNNSTITPRVVFKPNAAQKRRMSGAGKLKGGKDKKRKSAGPDDEDMDAMEVDGDPWSPETKLKATNGVKRGNSSPDSSIVLPEKKLRSKDSDDGMDEKVAPSSSPALQEKGKVLKTRLLKPPSHNSWMVVNDGFMGLLHSFQYLKVHELLRASCVSRMWALVASHYSLWETVRMKNSRVSDWKGFGKTLKDKRTKSLDLRKMLLPEGNEAIPDMWKSLSEAIKECETLEKIDMGRCTPHAIECVTKACPQLQSIGTLAVRGAELDLKCLLNCKNLREVKLKSIGGIEMKNIQCLKELSNLKHLSLTAVKSLEGVHELSIPSLDSLELGECTSLPKEFATVTLPSLKNLKRLRLEKGQGDCPTQAILTTVASLPNLTQLELINFDIKPGFDKNLAKCSNIRTLLIIPTYVTQSATTNHVVMGGVSKLSTTLTYFIWGLTLELLRVTDLFIDQVEGQKGKGQSSSAKKPGSGDSIPILKPLGDDSDMNASGASQGKEGQTSQVDILALPKLQRVLSTLLPTTKIKILKVPFSATWRQTVTDVPL